MKKKIQTWSQKEIDLLREIYPKKIWSIINNYFPYRSSKSIKRKSEELKLERGKHVRFEQMSLATKAKWINGCFDREVIREKCRLLGIERTKNQKGNKNSNWKGNKVLSNDKRLRNSIELISWRTSVFRRDNYTCQACNQVGGCLESHHIKLWSKYPKLRFDVDNGITLCKRYHKFIRGKEEKYEKMFKKLIKK